MKNIAIILARGGSKRIPRKNIKEFYGKPLIYYSINAAINSNSFDRIIVSTDDNEIATLAEKYGAGVPFMRSSKNSDDFATTVDVLIETLTKIKKNDTNYDNFCCLYPTAPFLTGNLLKKALEQFKHYNANTLFSICRFSYPIQRALKRNGDFIEMINPENYSKRSQDLEPMFHDAGQFYWGKVDTFLQKRTLFGDKAIGFELSELEVQDIDTITDWELAELKYQKFKETCQ